jgi:hypothetical protein
MRPAFKLIYLCLVCRRDVDSERLLGGPSQEMSQQQCICGTKRKRDYSKPVLRELPNVTILPLVESPAT